MQRFKFEFDESSRMSLEKLREQGVAMPPEAASTELSPHQMLHRLWTSCVDKPGYDKAAWREIERQLKSAGVVQ